MSEDQEKKQETTEVPEKTKGKSTKKSTKTKEAPKETKKKTIKKKKATKKVVENAVKDKKKTVVKKSAKKKTTVTKKKATTEKKEKPKKTVKPTKKTVSEKKDKPKKTTQKKETTTKTEAGGNFSIYEKFVAEAIYAYATEDKPWVSYQRIKQYLLDFMSAGLYTTIPKNTQRTLDKLTEKKYLKNKKNSYAFAKLGNEKLRPEKKVTRKKIERPVKAKPVEEKVPTPPKDYVTMSGRRSRQRVNE